MDIEVEPMQQPIRKAVGRPRDPKKVLKLLYQMQLFARRITQGRELIRQRDYYPVRKVVGRPHGGQR